MSSASPVIISLGEIGGDQLISLHGSFTEGGVAFERFKSISLLGTYEDYIKLEDHAGDLLEFEILAASENAPSYSGIGRIAGLHVAMTGQEQEVVQYLGRLDVSKISERYRRTDKTRRRYCSYVLEPRISNWESNFIFQFSYDGTITGKKISRGFTIFSNGIKIQIGRNYYYKKIEENHSVEQLWLPLISITGTSKKGQNRYETKDITIIQSSILLLSFLYNSNIRLVSKTLIDSKDITSIHWPPRPLETVERGYHDFAIEPDQITEFLNVGFENVRREEFDLDSLSIILKRYINGMNASSLESRITYISEAIEGVIAFAGLRGPTEITNDETACISKIDKIIDESDIHHKQKIKNRAKSIFRKDSWEDVKYIIYSIFPDNHHFKDTCLRSGRFFSIRNKIVHQGSAAWADDIYLQIDIASYIFKLLFCYIVGCPHVRPRPGHSLEYATFPRDNDKPPMRVFLWE